MRIDKSIEFFKKAQENIPGGVNSPVRAFRAVNRTPLFIDHAKGSKIYDVDGNEYIDYVCSWGPNILGHCNEEVQEAVIKATMKGMTFGAPTKSEIDLADLICETVPSIEMVRLVSSGTEAVMSAVRVARGYTKRDKIIKFKGCYHGHSDGLLVKAGSGALTESIPDSLGVPKDFADNTLIALYNDRESVENLFSANKDKIAAIIVEPVAANMGVVLPEEGFLEFLREITLKNDALLIFDEVITGFRLGLQGAQGYYGIKPDLTTFGKIIGGGMPVGAYGGRKDIMSLVAPLGPVYQAGTLSGNPVATAAGIKTIEILKRNPDIYEELNKKAELLKNTMEKVSAKNGLSVQVNKVGSLLCTFFTEAPVNSYDSALTSDTVVYSNFFGKMLDNGIYLAPSQFEAMFLSVAHSDDDIKRTCEVIKNI